jgi:hypothetical protein
VCISKNVVEFFVCSRRRVVFVVCAVEGEWGFWLCISTRVAVICVCSSRRVERDLFELEGEWGVVCAVKGDLECCVCIRRREGRCVCSRIGLGELCEQ